MRIKYRKDIYYLLLVSVILLFIWAGYVEDTRISNLFWIGVVMLIVPFITIIRGWFGIRVFRILPKGRIYAGKSIQIALEVKNTNFIPFLWMKIVDQYPIRYMVKHKKRGELSESMHFIPRGSKRATYYLDDVPRGKLKWGKITVFRSDLLGFVNLTKDLDLSQEMLVYPKYVNVSPEILLNKNENQGATRLLRGADYSQISGVREYARGDKLSLIHWKVSARKNSLMSKEFFPLLNQEAHIILDCDKNNYAYDHDDDFELAVSVAASLANSLAKYDQGLVLRLNNKQREVITFKNSSYFVSKVMERLALAEANGHQPLERLLNYHYLNDKRGVTLFIITNKITKNTLNKLYMNTGKVRTRLYLVGKGVDSETTANHPFITRVQSLEDLKASPGVRRVSNG